MVCNLELCFYEPRILLDILPSKNYSGTYICPIFVLLFPKQRRQLENRLEAGQVFVEFENVAKKRLKCECGAASQQYNKERNRFKDVLPYDDNRVKLTPTKDNPMGYVNASHIKVCKFDNC